jgi:hypothetical protein
MSGPPYLYIDRVRTLCPGAVASAILALLLCCMPMRLTATETPGSPLAQLVLALTDAPGVLRADLARSALLELSAAYTDEAERARSDLRRTPRNADLRRWLSAIERLAAEHASLAAAIEPTTPVDLRVGPDRTIQLNVAGNPVMLSGPRPSAQAALEQRVLDRYCNLHLCDPAAIAAVPASSRSAASFDPLLQTDGEATHWSFSPAGPACATADGLEFQFENSDDLRRKRIACAALVAELNRLADALARQSAMGVALDWNALAIAAQDEGHLRIVLNDGGADIVLRAPSLAVLPELLRILRPWLAARVQGQRYHLVVLNAGRQLAPLIAVTPP